MISYINIIKQIINIFNVNLILANKLIKVIKKYKIFLII